MIGAGHLIKGHRDRFLDLCDRNGVLIDEMDFVESNGFDFVDDDHGGLSEVFIAVLFLKQRVRVESNILEKSCVRRQDSLGVHG